MIKVRKLNSGVTLVMEKMPYFRSMAIGIWVKAGAVDENEEYSGISHFVEHMMFKGTKKRSAKQIAGDIDRIGGQINAFTGREATCYYVKTISTNYEKAADVLVDMLTASTFDSVEINKERQVINEEIKMMMDSPEDLANDAITTLVFSGMGLGKSVIGTPESLSRIDHDILYRYVAGQYTRDSIVVSVCGNYDEKEICDYFDGKFDSMPAAKPARKEEASDYAPKFKCMTKNIEQTHMCLAVRAVSATDPLYYAFTVLNNIMGGTMSSRLFQNVREQKGLAYSVYSMLGAFSHDGYYNIYAGVSHDKVEEAVQAIRSELASLKSCGVTDEELISSKEQSKASYIFGQESSAGRMFQNGKNLLLNGRAIEQQEVIDGFNKVTMDDMEKVKQKICNFELYSAVVVSDREMDMEKIMRD